METQLNVAPIVEDLGLLGFGDIVLIDVLLLTITWSIVAFFVV